MPVTGFTKKVDRYKCSWYKHEFFESIELFFNLECYKKQFTTKSEAPS